jgi:hypothetical protein
MAATSGPIGHAQFVNSWVFGKTGFVDSRKTWQNPNITNSVTTLVELLTIFNTELLPRDYDGTRGVFFGKNDAVPSFECLRELNVLKHSQNIFTFGTDEFELDQLKKVFMNIILRIIGKTVDFNIYDKILCVEFKLFHNKIGRFKQINIWTTPDIDHELLKEQITEILDCKGNESFYVPKALNFTAEKRNSVDQ